MRIAIEFPLTPDNFDLYEEINLLGVPIHLNLQSREAVDRWLFNGMDVSALCENLYSISLPKEFFQEDFCADDGFVRDFLAVCSHLDIVCVSGGFQSLDRMMGCLPKDVCLVLKDSEKYSNTSLIESYGQELRSDFAGLCIEFTSLKTPLNEWYPYTKIIRFKQDPGQGVGKEFVRKLVKDAPWVRELLLSGKWIFRPRGVKFPSLCEHVFNSVGNLVETLGRLKDGSKT